MKEDSPSYLVGLTYNLKQGLQAQFEDAEAEYDDITTVMAIKMALEECGCEVILLEANTELFTKLQESNPDIVFNIAEGITGRGREAQIPAILSFLKIPFTGSDETTLCIALDKALTKKILSKSSIISPRYQVIQSSPVKLRKSIRFPLIVKPNVEGSSKGIYSTAIIEDQESLDVLIQRNFQRYQQPMLIEEFVPGREFTVGIIGNGEDIRVFAPMEIVYKLQSDRNIYSYEVKKEYEKHVEYVCPANINVQLERKLKRTAKRIFNLLECRDFARIDFRLDRDNQFHFIEINPLPGLAPGYSDYPKLAEFCGVDYVNLIQSILNTALKRYAMPLI